MKLFLPKDKSSTLGSTLLKCQSGFSNYRMLGYRNFGVHRPTILPVVLYGYETWYLTLREEHRLRVFENSKKCEI